MGVEACQVARSMMSLLTEQKVPRHAGRLRWILSASQNWQLHKQLKERKRRDGWRNPVRELRRDLELRRWTIISTKTAPVIPEGVKFGKRYLKCIILKIFMKSNPIFDTFYHPRFPNNSYEMCLHGATAELSVVSTHLLLSWQEVSSRAELRPRCLLCVWSEPKRILDVSFFQQQLNFWQHLNSGSSVVCSSSSVLLSPVSRVVPAVCSPALGGDPFIR